jgi:hypothetical protein
MTGGVVYMHKWHIRAAQKYQGNMYVSLRTRAQIGIMEKQNQTKKRVFFIKGFGMLAFPCNTSDGCDLRKGNPSANHQELSKDHDSYDVIT